jgi:CubicO group peptidase (beta-lactamase class C family)
MSRQPNDGAKGRVEARTASRAPLSPIALDGAPAPQAAGFDAARLAAVEGMLRGQVERGRLPGAVMLVARRGTLAAFSALGRQDPSSDAPMSLDSIFRIHSMTKPIVSVALMRLVEAGRLRLGEPVSAHLPEFAATPVRVEGEGGPRLQPPKRPMTVHDLLRHTAGLTYEFLEPAPVRALYAQADIGSRLRSNAEQARALAGIPLMHEPGSAWDYSRATDILGRLIEVLTGETLGEHLKRAVFEPLGMRDTGFAVAAAEAHRIAEPFARDPQSGDAVQTDDPRVPAALQSGGGGLLSTAADYARFLQMLLQGGTLGGTRVLGRKTVEHMTSDHLGAIPRVGEELPPGHGFGLGFAVRLDTGIAALPGSVGTYGWGGIAGTVFFVDPCEAMFAILMIQAPGQRVEIQELFRTMVYSALGD